MSDAKCGQATPAATLEEHIMDSRHAKTEAEWWASREIKSLRQQLAECQAREKVLREALEYCDDLISHQFTGDKAAMTAMQIAVEKAASALYLQHGTTALNALLKQAKREALLEAADYAEKQSNEARDLAGDYAAGCSVEAESIAIAIRRMAKELE